MATNWHNQSTGDKPRIQFKPIACGLVAPAEGNVFVICVKEYSQ